MGQVASTLANIHSAKDAKPFIPDDFALGVPKTEAQLRAEMETGLRAALTNASGS